MKSPRDIILEQHRNAEARLQSIRAEDLAACAREAEAPAKNKWRDIFNPVSIATSFWREAIHPWRRVWLGMAAVWLAILAFNFAGGTGSRIMTAHTQSSEPQIIMAALREQKQLMAQLLGPIAPPVESRPKNTSPRSSLRMEMVVV